MDKLNTLQGRIKAARLAAGLSHEEVGQTCGVSRNSISQWESGKIKNPGTKRLKLFSAATNVPLGWLLAREGGDPDLSPRAGGRAKIMTRPAIDISARPVPEIDAARPLHHGALDLTPRAAWAIPQDVLLFSFRASPDRVAVLRMLRDGPPGIARDDYVLVDLSRAAIDDAGFWLVDIGGRIAFSVATRDAAGRVEITHAEGALPGEAEGEAQVLGRVAGVFRPA